VRDALQHGLAFDRKTNEEIAVGIRPDLFMDYIANAAELHRFGRFPDTFNLLTRASSLEVVSDQEVSVLSEPRRRIVETVSRLSRKSNFRQQVLQAYGNRCAITRVQLRLVDAAHVLSVGAPDSSDDVRNGIALAPTYHRAYDNGLIFLDDQYNMKINPAKVADLRTLKLDGGLQTFSAHLGRVNLPPDRRQWPKLILIRKANMYRRILV
jgi:putative restriction endonuclease